MHTALENREEGGICLRTLYNINQYYSSVTVPITLPCTLTPFLLSFMENSRTPATATTELPEGKKNIFNGSIN